MKPGWKTTEFWTTLIVQAAGSLTITVTATQSWLASVLVFLGMVAQALKYIHDRGGLKTEQLAIEADKPEPPAAGPTGFGGSHPGNTLPFLLLAVGLWVLGSSLSAESPAPLTFPPEHGEALVLPVAALDGDTVDFYYLIRARARLHGINAPEKTGPTAAAGKASKEFLASKLPSEPTRAVLLGREKYGRLLLRLYDADGNDLSEVMIEAGHAKPWDGKGPRP